MKPFVHHLITKARFSQQPIYKALRLSIEATKTHREKQDLEPQVNCALDKFKFSNFQTVVEKVFHDSYIGITVFMEPSKESLHKNFEVNEAHDEKSCRGTPENMQTLKLLVSAQKPAQYSKTEKNWIRGSRAAYHQVLKY